MSQLPKGWVSTKLSVVGNTVTGNTPPRKNPEFYGGDVPFVKPGDIEVDKELTHTEETLSELGCGKARVLKQGSVLVTCIGNIGRVGLAMKPMATNQQINSIEFSELILPKYGFYYCRTLANWLNFNASATTVAIINKSKFSEAPFTLAPLAEQKRIVEKLDEVLAQVDTIKARLDGIPDLLKRFRQSVLFNATSGAISKNWRELNSPLPTCKDEVVKKVFIEWCKSKEAEFLRKGKLQKNEKWKEKFPTPDFGEVAVSCWNAINLSSVAEVIDPNPSHRMPKYIDDGLPFISSENIVSLSCIDFVKGKKIQEEELVKQKTRYEVRDGTFAFTRIGTIGKSVLLPLPHSYGISHAMAVVNPFQSLMDSRFLILAMNCKSILSQAHEGVQSVGVPDLGIGKMKSFIIPLPSIEEQKEIVRLVDQYFAFADTIEAQVKKAQARVDNLTQSILAKAFRGELVPQNDDDESAEVLLKRIAQARKEADALAKAAKKAGKKKS
ncbi:restriction endonuclease subunit S [Vibrio diabolicus]|uniref:restriction endonuclease subunit S n=1 Tax=Vibrio diabolicus TaxID=50719 RepID=UPI00215F6945|nr:restriction endonuclease subunit S [Vibrio diabolicus]MCS0400530.1 restriction endonuclease subunit S [Vibrio diabolicus]